MLSNTKKLIINIFYLNAFLFSIFIGVFYSYFIKNDVVGSFVYILIDPLFLTTPLLLFKLKIVYENYTEDLKYILKALTSFILYLNGLGTAFLFDAPFEYDQFVHFLTFTCLSLIFFILYRIIMVDFLEKKPLLKMSLTFIVLFIILLLGGMLFEIYQYLTDLLFKSHMFFDKDQLIDVDVLTDIRANILGSIFGLFLIKVYWKNVKAKIVISR